MGFLEKLRFEPDWRDGDYIGEDGLLHCGVCHEAKEARYPGHLLLPGSDGRYGVPCACVRGPRDQARREYEQRQHLQETARLRAACFEDKRFYTARFEASTANPSQTEYCRKYAENLLTASDSSSSENGGLLLWGNIGSGKSYLAACIANALIEREIPVKMQNLSRILNTGFEERDEIMKTMLHYPVLILDDFGIERETEFSLEIIYNVIDTRYQSRKSLIITTNLTLSAIQNVDDLKLQRIYDRILSMCAPVQVVGDNLREAERAVCMERFREITAQQPKVDKMTSYGI